MDGARSDHPGVQRQLDRLTLRSPGPDVLGLDRVSRLLSVLGDPHLHLPPVLHVAGTNGKGSTCAYLRAAIEAAGLTAHVYTSPHLLRFNERIRIAGKLIEDDALASLLEEVLDAGDGITASFFEITTAAAFLAFSRTPADACIMEVGLGGRLDATNVIQHPIACGIAQLGLDHQFFLGDTIEEIAAEKAGIAKRGVPLLTFAYPPSQAAQVERVANEAGALWLPRGQAWDAPVSRGKLHYRDAKGELELPLPRMAGAHQAANAALAVAMLRHQQVLTIPDSALRAAMGWADWPARLQRLSTGPVPALLPAGSELWLDGGHNPAGARAIAEFFRTRVAPGRPFHILMGMLANKDLRGFLEPFAGSGVRLRAFPVPGHEHHAPEEIVAAAESLGLVGSVIADPLSGLREIAKDGGEPPVVMIGGTLYIAGSVLGANGTPPT
ncbi:bifunctional folylpolyglutamate synthase/dihydrofolate synthase [Sphingomonas sp. MMS24-J13]|uniref:bifunctional folylpolyglutamate synthase/dihydrofolate synthase n=1 Tax=Sphingomonas sp. MMS24-J13 TaxID=3238686 RepID=UPI00384B36EA